MSKRSLLLRPLALLVLLAVTACGIPAAPEESPTVAPTARVSGVPASATALLTAAPPAVPTPGPPTLTPTAIERPTNTPAPEPTVDYAATNAVLIPKVMTASPARHVSSFPSADGRWKAQLTHYDCVKVEDDWYTNRYDELRLIRSDAGASQVVDYQVQYCEGVGAYGLGALFWSPNSRYFYYTTAAYSVPDGFCYYWARPWVRVEAATGHKDELTEGPLAPDGKRLAFSTWNSDEVILWGLDEGRLASVKTLLPSGTVGPLAWSPDGQSVVYLQWSDYCPEGKSYLVRIDWTGPSQVLLLESAAPVFVGLRWDAPNRLRLSDAQGGQWTYNLVTEHLSRVP